MGENWETRRNLRQEMGNETEFETRNGRKWDSRRYKIHPFSMKNEKNSEKMENRGEKTLKNRKKTEN